jgi:hypothetical protein
MNAATPSLSSKVESNLVLDTNISLSPKSHKLDYTLVFSLSDLVTLDDANVLPTHFKIESTEYAVSLVVPITELNTPTGDEYFTSFRNKQLL